MVESSNLMSVLMTNLAISLKWITVTLKIEMDQKHGTKGFLDVCEGGEFECDVRSNDRYGCQLEMDYSNLGNVVQNAFWRFAMVESLNLMSVLMTDLAVSLKWITVALKIEMYQRHGTNCFLEV